MSASAMKIERVAEAFLPKNRADLGPEFVDLVQPFVDAGLVRLEPFDVVNCADVEDGDDWDPGCDGWTVRRDSDELECDRCERIIWFEPEHVRQRFRARIVRATVERWLRRRLEREGQVERLRGGSAWLVRVADDEVTVAVLDWSEETKWVDAGRMDSDATLLILIEPLRYRTALREGVVAVDLEELVIGHDLSATWPLAIESAIAFDRPRAWMPSHTLPNRYHCRRLGAHVLEAVDGSLRVDGVAVERTAAAFPIVRWLIARHAEDVAAGKSADGHCWWPAQELADELSGESPATRAQVKRALARFTAETGVVYRNETGLPLGQAALIESSRAGYRVNPSVYGRLA
jgi:hypothetical protein